MIRLAEYLDESDFVQRALTTRPKEIFGIRRESKTNEILNRLLRANTPKRSGAIRRLRRESDSKRLSPTWRFMERAGERVRLPIGLCKKPFIICTHFKCACYEFFCIAKILTGL